MLPFMFDCFCGTTLKLIISYDWGMQSSLFSIWGSHIRWGWWYLKGKADNSSFMRKLRKVVLKEICHLQVMMYNQQIQINDLSKENKEIQSLSYNPNQGEQIWILHATESTFSFTTEEGWTDFRPLCVWTGDCAILLNWSSVMGEITWVHRKQSVLRFACGLNLALQ